MYELYIYAKELAKYLPQRKAGLRGPKPIPEYTLIYEILKKLKYNIPWRYIRHSTICREYYRKLRDNKVMERVFGKITKKLRKGKRLDRMLMDSSDIVSYKTNPYVKYSGKYHNYCIKMTVLIDTNLTIIDYSLDKGSASDSKILDKILRRRRFKLPYELFLDKGYENYQRRRMLKKQNCQVRMEMKKLRYNRKRGPRFKFTDTHKKIRADVEKVFGWIKSYATFTLSKFRYFSYLKTAFLLVISIYALKRLHQLF